MTLWTVIRSKNWFSYPVLKPVWMTEKQSRNQAKEFLSNSSIAAVFATYLNPTLYISCNRSFRVKGFRHRSLTICVAKPEVKTARNIKVPNLVSLCENLFTYGWNFVLKSLQKLPGLETNFKLRDRDHDGSRLRPRPMRKSRDQDRDHKKSVSRPTALTPWEKFELRSSARKKQLQKMFGHNRCFVQVINCN